MAFEISKIKTDADGELNGVWTDDLGDGLKLKVARWSNSRFQAAVHEAAKKKMNGFGEINIDEAEARPALIKLMARHILKDFEGLTENGEPIQNSELEKTRLMLDYNDFFELVRQQSMNVELFRVKQTEEAGKASEIG